MKFHFRTQQGIKNLSDEEAEAIIGKDRESHQRDLYESIERGDFPRWTLYVQIMPEKDAATYRLQSLRPDQGLAQEGLSADRGRRPGTEPQPGELLRRRRAGGVQPGQRRPRHRLLARQDAAGAAVLLRRCAALPAGREPPPDSRQPRRAAPSTATTATAPCAWTATTAAPSATSPTATANGSSSRSSPSRRWPGGRGRPLELPRGRDDYYTQPGRALPADEPREAGAALRQHGPRRSARRRGRSRSATSATA